jgi:hypothetical protein
MGGPSKGPGGRSPSLIIEKECSALSCSVFRDDARRASDPAAFNQEFASRISLSKQFAVEKAEPVLINILSVQSVDLGCPPYRHCLDLKSADGRRRFTRLGKKSAGNQSYSRNANGNENGDCEEAGSRQGVERSTKSDITSFISREFGHIFNKSPRRLRMYQETTDLDHGALSRN